MYLPITPVKLNTLPLKELEQLVSDWVFLNERNPPNDADRLAATLARLGWKRFDSSYFWVLAQTADGSWGARIRRRYQDGDVTVIESQDQDVRVAVYRTALKFISQ